MLIRCLRYAKIKTADLTYTSYRAKEKQRNTRGQRFQKMKESAERKKRFSWTQ